MIPLVSQSEILKLASDLIKIPTVNPPGRVKEAIDYIAEYLEPFGLKVTRVEGYSGKPNLVVEYGQGQRTLLWNTHIDVVPPGDEPWEFDPFRGQVSDGYLWGRGASDTKGAVAAMLGGLLALVRSEVKLNGSLKLTIVSDEENLGPAGTRYLAEKGWLKADAAIVGEPTNLTLEIVERGLIWFDLISRGQVAHSGRPHLGVNALENLIDLMKYFRDDYSRLIRQREHPWVSPPSLSLTMIQGGRKINLIPDVCTLSCDRRVIPGEDLTQVTAELRGIIERFSDERRRFELDLKKSVVPIEVSPNEAVVAEMKKAVEEVTGRKAEMRGKDAATDAYIIRGELGIPTVIFGPGDSKLAHKANEMVLVENMVLAAQTLALTARKMLG
ncbi:MAG: ArgE/DapE family deacylase [Thermodesulfobacteriota bacterium]